VLGGLRVPRRAIEAAIQDIDPERVTVLGGEGIVVIDLRDTLPAGLDLKVLTVQATDRSLHLWFGRARCGFAGPPAAGAPPGTGS